MVRTMVATHGWARLGTRREQVGPEVSAAPLPAGSAEDCGHGASESLMSVLYHQLHPAEAPG